MGISIGQTLRRRRQWARLTLQELVDHTRIDRSASYVGAVETGKTSPTLAELERLARYYSLSVIELLEEAADESASTTGAPSTATEPDDRLARLFNSLNDDDQDLAVEFLELLARRRR